MTSAPLVPHSASDPIWGFVAQLRAARFTGEAIMGVGPRVRLFCRQGVVYLAEREGDPPLPSRLVAAGALTAEQLAKGVMLVDGVMSLSKLFLRAPSADRTSIELAITHGNDTVLAAVADDPVVTVELHPDHHHSSGIHEWLPEPAADDLAPFDDALTVSAPAAPPVDAPPALLHMPDSSHLVDPLPAATPRRIEPIRIEPVHHESAHHEPVHHEPLVAQVDTATQSIGAPTTSTFAPPQFAESALLAPPPIPALVGLEEMSAFEQQFHVDLEPAAAPGDEAESVAVVAPADVVEQATPTLPTLPTLGAPMSWQPSTATPPAFTPHDDLSTMDLPKLAATSKSVAEIVADQARANEPVPEPAVEPAVLVAAATVEPLEADATFTPLARTQSGDPFASLPRFSDLVGGDSALTATAARHDDPTHAFDIDAGNDHGNDHGHDHDHDHGNGNGNGATVATTATRVERPAPVFETETLWTPPPADHTAAEIWNLVDDMARPAASSSATTRPDDDTRDHRFHLGRRSGRRSSKG